MENKILELLLEMQKDIKDVQRDIKYIQKDIKDINNKLNDGFETLELLSENNATGLNRVKIQVSKLEKRVNEINDIN